MSNSDVINRVQARLSDKARETMRLILAVDRCDVPPELWQTITSATPGERDPEGRLAVHFRLEHGLYVGPAHIEAREVVGEWAEITLRVASR